MHTATRIQALAAFAVAVTSSIAAAATQPLWEAGAGVAAIDFPHYRGSDQRQLYVLPLPYFVYRGELLQVDRQGMRGLFYRGPVFETDISVNGSTPVRSKDDRARAGMRNLDPTLEIGPSLNATLMRSADERLKLDLRLPVRAVIASDFSYVRQVGWIFQPQLNLDVRDAFGTPGWNLGLAAGPIFGDARLHNYFYGVEPQYATAERPAYRAGGGYAGSQFVAALGKRFAGTWVGSFVKFDTLRGAVFEDSPLVRTRSNVTVGFGIAWVFAESQRRVEERR